jgi:hypothetical protein
MVHVNRAINEIGWTSYHVKLFCEYPTLPHKAQLTRIVLYDDTMISERMTDNLGMASAMLWIVCWVRFFLPSPMRQS